MMACDMQIWVGAYVIDALGPRGSQRISTHLANCESCRDQVVSLCLETWMFDGVGTAGDGTAGLYDEVLPAQVELATAPADSVVVPRPARNRLPRPLRRFHRCAGVDGLPRKRRR